MSTFALDRGRVQLDPLKPGERVPVIPADLCDLDEVIQSKTPSERALSYVGGGMVIHTQGAQGISECLLCGWRGVPTLIKGAVSHDCPMCDAAADYVSTLERPYATPPEGGRNAPCSCGSGRKWKKCHGSN